MRRLSRLLIATMAALVLAAPALPATADPGEDHGHSHSGPPELPPFTGSATSNMDLVANADKDGVVNSDLAFWEDLAFAGNYNGFRILDISDPAQPELLSDYFCHGPQNDVSVYRFGNRLILFQSIDRPQSQESCDGTQAGSSVDTPIIQPPSPDAGRAQFGFEGIRMYDVTNPRNPVFLDGIPTACGSHTHTLVPDHKRRAVQLYIASYPLGSNVTPASFTGTGPRCASPHQKISIVTVPFRNPMSWQVKEKALSADTDTYPGAVAGDPLQPPFKACHDVQVLEKKHVAVASCAGDTQLWDVSDPANPTTGDNEPHTHIREPGGGDEFEFMHSAVITWDGKFFATMDETGGGGTPECDGSAEEKGGQSESGFYYFYKLVKPGDPAPPLLSRFMIPRPQGTQICVSHNANVLPVGDRYLMSMATYMGGNTVVDFTDPTNPVEVAYSDIEDASGAADSWSTYWYNDFVYANGGLNRRGATQNRGLDIFTVTDANGNRLTTRDWHHSNPQTQEISQGPGR